MSTLTINDAGNVARHIELFGQGTKEKPFRFTDSPCTHAAVVTASADNLPGVPEHGAVLYCSVAGTATIVTVGGETVSVTMVAGGILPLMVRKVTAAAATLLAMWNDAA